MKQQWDIDAFFSLEFLSTRDAQGDPGFELVMKVHTDGESNDTGRGANDPDNYYVEDRELVEAYLVLHPDGKKIELPKEVQQSLYDQLGIDEIDPQLLAVDFETKKQDLTE